MGIALLKFLDAPWEKARGYLREDLDSIEAVFNQRWGATFGDSNQLNLATTVTGVLPADHGGTGFASYTTGDLLYAPGPTALGKLPVGTAGTILIGGSLPAYSATPTVGTSLTVPLLIGGTAVGATLTIKSTSGVGTTDALIFQVGNNGATEALRLTHAGNAIFVGNVTVPGNLGVTGAITDPSGSVIDIGDGTDDVSLIGGQIYLDRTTGNTGFGVGVSPTAILHLKAGTAGTGAAPLKLTSGTNLTTAEPGAFEYNGTNLFFTRSGTTREHVLVAVDGVSAPSTTAGVAIVNFYGSSDANFLGTPNRWLSVNVLGTVYKIPLYT